MTSVPRRARSQRSALTALAVGLACAATGMAAAPAGASFTLDRCEGDTEIKGRGASFQNNAQNAWRPAFISSPAGCPGHEAVQYNSALSVPGTGSGNGRGAMGSGEGSSGTPMAVPGQRDAEVRFGATDEGPSPTQQGLMNAGQTGNAADDGKVRVVPVAGSAIAVIVNYPRYDSDPGAATASTICPLPSTYSTGGDAQFARLQLPNWKLEQAWAGEITTWGELLEDYDAAGDAYQGLPTMGPAPTGNDDTDLTAEYAAGCVDRKIIRATRQDNSGTTYAFKDFLDFAAQIDDGSDNDPRTGDGSDTDWRPGLTSTPLLNRSWPNTTPDNGVDVEEDNPPQDPTLGETAGTDADSSTVCFTATNPIYGDAPVCHNRATGNGGTVAVTRSNVGSIGYADLATVRSSTASSSFQKENAGDSLYTMPIAVRDSVTAFVDPAKDPNGFKQFKPGSADQQPSGGASCDDVTIRDLPSGSDPTTGTGWDVTSMVYPAAGYGICTLTYVLAWDDNAPVYVSGLGGNYALEERRARAVKDYLDFVVSDTGQSLLTTADYSVLPEAVQTLSDTAVARIDWDKANTGNTGGGDTGTNTDNGGTGGGGGGGGAGSAVVPNPPPSGTPPVGGPLAAPINAFTIPSTRTRGSDVFATFRLPGAGRLVVAATGRYTEKVKRRIRRGGRTRTRTRNVRRTVQVARATVTVSRAGDLSVRLPVSSAARRALRKTSRMVVTVTAVFTPAGGQANTVTRTLTLRGTRRR